MFKILAAAAALSLIAMPAVAQVQDDVFSIRIPHADLNLATPAGAARMATRIRAAVRRACQPQTAALIARSAEQRCRRTLSDQADAQMAMLVHPATVQVASLH